MDESRAAKVIFTKLWEQFSNNETFRYLSSIKDILTCVEMDHLFAKDANIYVPTFKGSLIRSGQIQFTQDLDSLLMYKLIKTNTSPLNYSTETNTV